MYLTLHWADKMNAPETDYDLIVLNSSGQLVTFSSSRSSAFEMVTISGSTSTFRIYVARYSGPAKLFSIRASKLFSFSAFFFFKNKQNKTAQNQ